MIKFQLVEFIIIIVLFNFFPKTCRDKFKYRKKTQYKTKKKDRLAEKKNHIWLGNRVWFCSVCLSFEWAVPKKRRIIKRQNLKNSPKITHNRGNSWHTHKNSTNGAPTFSVEGALSNPLFTWFAPFDWRWGVLVEDWGRGHSGTATLGMELGWVRQVGRVRRAEPSSSSSWLSWRSFTAHLMLIHCSFTAHSLVIH